MSQDRLHDAEQTQPRPVRLSRRATLMGGAGLIASSLTPAFAQKAKDTMRVGIHQPVSSIDGIFDPSPQTSMMARMVLDHLVNFNATTKQVTPCLAESWTRIDGKTYEFRLRKDVVFHNGQPLDADDVVYSLTYILDPETRFRFKDATYGWLAGAQKIDAYTVRLQSKTDFAPFLARLTTGLPILPSKYHASLKDRSQFGRTPIGTGPYRALEVDNNRGVTLVRSPSYKHGDASKPAGRVERIVLSSIPDEQTRVAKMMVGDLDLIYDVSADVANSMAQNPSLAVSYRPTNAYAYLMLDAVGRSASKVMTDKRVREAVMRGIDRKALVRALQPKEIAEMPLQPSMCHPWNVGCAASTEPPAYDPDLAKKMLADAGYANGFPLSIATWGASIPVAEAVAGQLRRIGVNVSLDVLALPAFVKKRGSGELTAYVVLWDNSVGAPDVENTAGFFYAPGDRNYNGDKELTDLYFAGQVEFDPQKRQAIYQRLFDKVNVERYSMPLIPLAGNIVHAKDVVIPPPGSTYTEGFTLNTLAWA